jgi:hypothetical protein
MKMIPLRFVQFSIILGILFLGCDCLSNTDEIAISAPEKNALKKVI